MTKKEYREKSTFLNNDFVNQNNEWYNIEPTESMIIERIIPRIINLTPNKDSFKICDAGIGLGTTMYCFYEETKVFKDKDFKFYGVEKYKEYVDFFNNNLKQYWDDKIVIYTNDIMKHNYGEYDIVYTYAPFKKEGDLMCLYQKIIDELKTDSVLFEYALNGNGFYNTIQKTHKNNQNKTNMINIMGHTVLVVK